jgi:hypothetical protein
LVAVKEAKESLEKLARARAALPAAAISIRREIAEIDPRYRKEKVAAILPPGMTEKQVRDAQWRKRSSVLSGAVGSLVTKLQGNTAGPPKDSNDLLKARLQLNDPSHDAELKRIQAEAMLNALTNSDEVIGSYSPEEVADAFEEVGQSAPNLVTNMSLLRANMRKQLAGNLTPYEADAMVQSALKSQPREIPPRDTPSA